MDAGRKEKPAYDRKLGGNVNIWDPVTGSHEERSRWSRVKNRTQIDGIEMRSDCSDP